MTNALVKGYMVNVDYEHEALYAVFADGRVYCTGTIKNTNSFLGHGRKWQAVDAVPADAEYIGNYPYPKVTA